MLGYPDVSACNFDPQPPAMTLANSWMVTAFVVGTATRVAQMPARVTTTPVQVVTADLVCTKTFVATAVERLRGLHRRHGLQL